ncbi:MAG: PspC domain-containing protein [Micrococcaceae bacterium]
MKNKKAMNADAVFTEPVKTNIFGQKDLGSGTKMYPSDNFTDKTLNKIRNLGVYRSDNAWLGGVCGMIADKTGWNVNYIRIATVVLTFFLLGATLSVYGLAWFLLPDSKGRIHAQEIKHDNISLGGGAALLMSFIGLISLFWGKIVTLVVWAALLAGGFFAIKYWGSKKAPKLRKKASTLSRKKK